MNASPNPQKFPRWAFIVVALLAGHVTLMTAAVTFALRGYGSAGVEPDYYARAVAWDADQALLQQSEALDWQVTLTPDIWQDADGRRTLTVSASDAQGRAIYDAQVALRMHHAVYPGRKADATLTAQGEGLYAAKLPGLTPGLWRVDVKIIASQAESETMWYGQFDQQIADVVTLGDADANTNPKTQTP